MPQLTGRDAADAAREMAQSAMAGWESVRERYSLAVQERVAAVMSRGGLTLADLVAMTLADYERVLEFRRGLSRRDVAKAMQLTSTAARLRGQLFVMVQASGGGIDPDAPVPIPADVMRVLMGDPDYGRDLLTS